MVVHGLPFLELLQIINGNVHDCVHSFLRKERLMCGQQDIVVTEQVHQRWIGNASSRPILEEIVSFVFVDVSSVSSDNARLNAFQYGVGIHQPTSGGVDENDARLQLVQHVIVDRVFGWWKKWHW